MFIRLYFFIISLLLAQTMSGLPRVGLGTSSFLDGGPLRPKPGLYLQQYCQYYQAHKIIDNKGGSVAKNFFARSIGVATQLTYQFDNSLPGIGTFGFDFTLPFIVHSTISKNPLGLTTSGGGLADLLMGTYIQWNTIMKGERPIFVHRMEFNISFPIGKNKFPRKIINPGNDFLFIDPYWSATLYFTPSFGLSWRLSYLWCAKNNKVDLRFGQAIHANYALEYNFFKRLYAGINGYFLQQTTDNTINKIKIKDSHARIFGLGPGLLYFLVPNGEFVMFANLFFEFGARDLTQGVRFVTRLFKHF